MADEGVRSPNEADITQLFMAHYVMHAYNGCPVAYADAKVRRRYDRDRRNTVILGKFRVPEESGLPESQVTFMAMVHGVSHATVIVSILNTVSGNFENYVLPASFYGPDGAYEAISYFVASAVTGGEDPQNKEEGGV